MSATQTTNDGFDSDLRTILPRLRVYAMSLTRSSDRADELVQQTVMKALAGRQSFRPGTNFTGWMFRIGRNEFISELRRKRRTAGVDMAGLPELLVPPRQEDGMIMRDFKTAFRQLSRDTRQALLLSQLEGFSEAQIADHTGVKRGTVKSRISRGRVMLGRLLAPAINPLLDGRAHRAVMSASDYFR